jgi:hypothetical protein
MFPSFPFFPVCSENFPFHFYFYTKQITRSPNKHSIDDVFSPSNLDSEALFIFSHQPSIERTNFRFVVCEGAEQKFEGKNRKIIAVGKLKVLVFWGKVFSFSNDKKKEFLLLSGKVAQVSVIFLMKTKRQCEHNLKRKNFNFRLFNRFNCFCPSLSQRKFALIVSLC